MKLYGFWRSSAVYRVRIALNLKGLTVEHIPVSLLANEQSAAAHLARNPQGLVPALDTGTTLLTQSLAIIEYLDEIQPTPPLLPRDAVGRAQVRSMALAIACDVHPLNNLRALKYLKAPLGLAQSAIDEWVRHWIAAGFAALETMAHRHSADGRCLYGAAVTMADCSLVPQMYNARRFNCDLAPYPTLTKISDSLESRAEFKAAAPERQSDAGS
jgi:maleylacetoacetate isomerase/maleylpyruvate isomerase